MSSDQINTKTIARIASIQTIYQYQLDQHQDNIAVLIEKMLNFYQDEQLSAVSAAKARGVKPLKIKLNINHFKNLVSSTIDNLSAIDLVIADHLVKKLPINNLSPLLRASIRVAICELTFFPATPCKVIINEFTDIANEMLNDSEVGFINSILAKIAGLA